jgi:hypothetical protein
MKYGQRSDLKSRYGLFDILEFRRCRSVCLFREARRPFEGKGFSGTERPFFLGVFLQRKRLPPAEAKGSPSIFQVVTNSRLEARARNAVGVNQAIPLSAFSLRRVK